jgi:TonB-dependent receptor
MTSLIDQTGSVAAATAQFSANYSGGNLSQAFIDQVLQAYNVSPDANDPFYVFQVQKPINNEEGHIYGFEIAGQYFLGESGFGVAGAYTMVQGDIGYDITAPTSADQFALLGLSDTANATLIFEKFGFSARLAWNWRGTFLSNNSRGGSRNPVFVKSYDQLDLNLSYDINDHISLSFEGINLTKSNVETFARTQNEPWFIVEGDRRFYLGARFRF